MANAYLLIGIGGTGRGVLNHVKYDLEQSFGNPIKAHTVLLAFDGPPAPSQYALPGQYEIDCSPASPEFYRLKKPKSPADAGRRIAQGAPREEDRYIAAWLSQAESKKFNHDIWNPEAGFGGQPVPGHAYFHLDINDIYGRVLQAYQTARNLLQGQADEEIPDGSMGGQQVIVCLIGSHSGGTGAGLLWDIAHLLTQIVAPHNDLLYAFIPWGMAYHHLIKSQEEKLDLDAKNFAALLSCRRFMGATPQHPSFLPFGNLAKFQIINGQFISIPFFIDGRGGTADITKARPQEGVVPVIADFLVTLIKDNLTTAGFTQNMINWATTIAQSSDAAKRYATIGSYSIRFPYLDVLDSFTYKFTYEIFNEILNYQPGNRGKGETLAKTLLNDITFTTMWEDKGAVPLSPDAAKILGDRIKVGRGDAVPPEMISLLERVSLKSWGLFSVPDEEVIQDAEVEMGDDRRKAENFLKIQRPKLLSNFEKKINETLLDIFYHRGSEPWTQVTLQENPNSIVITRDFLKHLRGRSDEFNLYVETKFREYYFPDGEHKPDLISLQLQRVEEKKKVMLASEKNVRTEQEDFLKESDLLLRYQVWQQYITGILDISRLMREYLQYLWRMIGDDTEGWIRLLDSYSEEMRHRYSARISRRREFARTQLRQYLPEPGGQAEERLFEELADPNITALMGKMTWTLAIEVDSRNPEERVTIVLNTPRVEGFHYPEPKRHVIDKATGERVAVGIYNPYEHVAYAKQVLEPGLKNTTLWKIMELDFRFDWLEDHQKEFARLSMEEARKERRTYVAQQVDDLVTRNAALLGLNQTPQHPEGIYIGYFQELADDAHLAGQEPEFRDAGGELAHLLSKELRRRVPTLGSTNVLSHPELSHELRAATAYLSLSLEDWQYFHEAKTKYLEYHRDPHKTLLNIYVPEQNALQVRKLIQLHLDHSFHDLLHPEVAALLSDLKIFTRLGLCYLMGVIPTRKTGLELMAPTEYYLPHDTGDISLAEKEDLAGLFRCVCRSVYKTPQGTAVPNELVQRKIKELWLQQEEQGKADLKGFLDAIEQQAQTMPKPLGEIQWYRHLALAIQTVVLDYVVQVRRSLGLAPPQKSTGPSREGAKTKARPSSQNGKKKPNPKTE